jgi:hypothetical protein
MILKKNLNKLLRESMEKAVATLALTITILALCFVPAIAAETDSKIVINADGTVTPSNTPIKQDGDNYLLTSYYQGTIEILRNNIVFNGGGNTFRFSCGVWC